jgi:hypothetical protein
VVTDSIYEDSESIVKTELVGTLGAEYNASVTAGPKTSHIQSPGYPGYYSNNLDCWWTITAPLGERISFQFTDMSLEEDYDFVYIYDGNIVVAIQK